MRTEAKIALTLILAGGAVGGCSSPEAQAQPTIDVEGIKNQVGTEIAGTLFAPTATATATPDFPSPTITPLSESTPLPEFDFVMSQVLNPNFITQYLASRNQLVDETHGESKTTFGRLDTYFNIREQMALDGEPVVEYDRMFGQLYRPVKDFSDRQLDFDKRNDGQGLGFSHLDLDVLYSLDEVLTARQPDTDDSNLKIISRRDENGFDHGWIHTLAKDADKAVLALIDNWLVVTGRSLNPTTDSLVQELRRTTFIRIFFGDLGVTAGPDGDNDWQTVNDLFQTCVSYTDRATQRTDQPEVSRRVEFDPTQEVPDNNQEEENATNRDSDDAVLVVSVISPTGQLRIEVYTLSNTQDEFNPSLDTAEESESAAEGGRWLPCGVAFATPTPTSTPESVSPQEVVPTPKNTPKPPKETPMPTNEHVIPPATSGPKPTNEPVATDIP